MIFIDSADRFDSNVSLRRSESVPIGKRRQFPTFSVTVEASISPTIRLATLPDLAELDAVGVARRFRSRIFLSRRRRDGLVPSNDFQRNRRLPSPNIARP